MDVQSLIDSLNEVKDKTLPIMIPEHYTESGYEEASYIVVEDGEVVIY